MRDETASGRWWENYLVRYLMPSIAGVGIVSWLIAAGPKGLRAILFFGGSPQSLDAPTLTLLILYGNLFCYIASYPILCFHATRVLDFDQSFAWRPRANDSYIASAVFAVGTIASAVFLPSDTCVFVSVIFVLWYVSVQTVRIVDVLKPKEFGKTFGGMPTTPLYAYLYMLSRRRGYRDKKTLTKSIGNQEPASGQGAGSSEQSEVQQTWRREVVESYRHAREHGNSAFIFALELALAAVSYGIVRMPLLDGTKALAALAALFIVWSVPAVLVHLLGQYIERRYSRFEG
ncbi:putative uncharacterized protein [Burkholderiales bacterium GJ-E10]|nr:putative uncharacterized protein [Burkholderiales bacterium GJ-E10]